MKSLDGLIAEYLAHLSALRYSPATVSGRKRMLGNFSGWLGETFGIRTADRIRSDHLRQWHTCTASARTAEGIPLKAASLNNRIISVRTFLAWLADNGHVRHRLLREIPCLRQPRNLSGSVLTHDQTRALMNKIRTDTPEGFRNRTVTELLYSSGIRAAELLGLDTGDTDFSAGTVRVTGKGNRQRIVPVGKTAMRYLKTRVRAVRPYMIRSKDEQALFIGRNGTRLTYRSLRTMIRKVSEQAGPDMAVTTHTFRRSCATELIRSGANIYHVKELLGHESLDTLKHYTRLTITDLIKTHRECHPGEQDPR